MPKRATASFLVLFFGLSLSLHAEDAVKPVETSADEKDLCSYLKDVDSKTEADCGQETLAAFKAKDPAAYSQKIELAHKRKADVLKAYEFLKAQPSPDQQTPPQGSGQNPPSPIQLQLPINERTFPAWIGPEAKDLKEVYTRWLQAQNQELQREQIAQVSPERRKEIDAALAANQVRIAGLQKLKDPSQFRCFLGESCGGSGNVTDPAGQVLGTGKGSWTTADYERANKEAKRQNLVVVGKPGAEPSNVPLEVTDSKGTPAQSGPLPLLPITLPIGVGLMGYGVYRSRDSFVSANGVNPNPPEPTPEQAEHARKINSMIKSGIVATVLVAGGGAIAEFTAPTISTVWNEGAVVVRIFLSGATPTMTPALVSGGTAGAGTAGQVLAVEHAGVYAKAALQTAGTIIGAKTASDSISYAKSDKIPTNQELSQEAGKPDPVDKGNQYTKAGRSLMKHNQFSRPGSNLPQPKGNPGAINKTAQELVERILSDPKRTESFEDTGRFGRVLEIRRADGIGIRFGPNNEFLHFIE